MRETETTYETVEQEVERIYCDECGARCDDDWHEAPSRRLDEDYQMITRELCADCYHASGLELLAEVRQDWQDWDDDSSIVWDSKGQVLFTIILFPALAIFVALDAANGKDFAKFMLLGAVGAGLWVAGILLLLLVVL